MRTLRLLAFLGACASVVVQQGYSDNHDRTIHDSDTPTASKGKVKAQSLSADNEFFESGTAFLKSCSAVDRVPGKEQNSVDVATARACQSYVLGIADGVDLQHMWSKSHGDQTKAAFCVQFEHLPTAQLVDAVLQYLRDNPDRRRFRAAIGVEEALHNKFPCK